MNLKQYLLLAVVGTALCWLAWAIVLFQINPFVSGMIGLGSFYLSLFLALLGTFSIAGFFLRRLFARQVMVLQQANVSIRQGLWLAIVVVGGLLLRGTGLYTWWSLTFLIAGCTVLEFFFLTREA